MIMVELATPISNWKLPAAEVLPISSALSMFSTFWSRERFISAEIHRPQVCASPSLSTCNT
jgi:hypothetical protein